MQWIYFPLFPVWLFYSIKARSLFFFNAANPSIRNGGLTMESKKEIYDIIPTKYIPKTVLVDMIMPVDQLIERAKTAGIEFPMIAKPDIGMKAFGVEKILGGDDLDSYARNAKAPFLLQELINYGNEIGIFYCRLPGSEKGMITGIVEKRFLTITGNGCETMTDLIKSRPRSFFQLASLRRKYGALLNEVLADGEDFILIPFGSHTRGSEFIDITDQCTDTLVNTIDSICRQIPGFYFGRLDIRYTSLLDLSHGENFSIIEINGAGSEPTHIYDPRHSIFFAWKEIIRHWNLLYQISTLNFENGHPYLTYTEGRKLLKENSKLEAALKLI